MPGDQLIESKVGKEIVIKINQLFKRFHHIRGDLESWERKKFEPREEIVTHWFLILSAVVRRLWFTLTVLNSNLICRVKFRLTLSDTVQKLFLEELNQSR